MKHFYTVKSRNNGPTTSENLSITETVLKFLGEFSLLSIMVITEIRLQQNKMVGPLTSVRAGVNSFIYIKHQNFSSFTFYMPARA